MPKKKSSLRYNQGTRLFNHTAPYFTGTGEYFLVATTQDSDCACDE